MHAERLGALEPDSGSNPLPRRLERLGEELEEQGLPVFPDPMRTMVLQEVDQALRPEVHERHALSGGAILEPSVDPQSWAAATELEITRRPLGGMPLSHARRFVDGLSSWLLRRNKPEGDEWLLFDRPAGSERDLVVLAESMKAVLVQRHPSGAVRIVGDFGVLRWEGVGWDREPPVSSRLETLISNGASGEPEVLEAILRLAVHDLGALGIGALLVHRTDDRLAPDVEEQLPPPPPLRVRKPSHLAPLRHALAQVDGAAIFDAGGTLQLLGVRLVPSRRAENAVAPWRGTRHTSALRYSFDHPSATVVVVSEDGPISVARAGEVLSPRT
jgi:hypothetical protein